MAPAAAGNAAAAAAEAAAAEAAAATVPWAFPISARSDASPRAGCRAARPAQAPQRVMRRVIVRRRPPHRATLPPPPPCAYPWAGCREAWSEQPADLMAKLQEKAARRPGRQRGGERRLLRACKALRFTAAGRQAAALSSGSACAACSWVAAGLGVFGLPQCAEFECSGC
eukprot:360794-Chlamydomonas_euryale.AAC.4